jgi:putative two-component system response regulator
LSTDPRRQALAGAVILIVEDNDALRQGLQILLESDGFTVISAIHGQDALERMKTTCPDLILSDISMPVMNGYEFFDAVRARSEWLTVPIIFLTAHSGRDELFQSKRMGVEDYLIKPVSRQELITTVRSRLTRSQQLMYAQLKQAYEASLIMLSNAIELRDQYTRGHVERVRDISSAMARHLGLNYSQMNSLLFGSILHDVGKIYIRECILRKPGSLDPDEWVEMQRHSAIGADLIQNIPYLASAIPVIRYHHERWDGKGYPEGLAGNEIPLEARIVAISDSLDAMTSVRVYQATFTPEQAYAEILRCSGTRYDPEIVHAFCEVWNEIEPLLSK